MAADLFDKFLLELLFIKHVLADALLACDFWLFKLFGSWCFLDYRMETELLLDVVVKVLWRRLSCLLSNHRRSLNFFVDQNPLLHFMLLPASLERLSMQPMR